MKNILKSSLSLIMLTLVFGLFSFTTVPENNGTEAPISCHVYKADLTPSKWDEIANDQGFESYFIIEDASLNPSGDHLISSADYNGDWSSFMACLELPAATVSIVIEEVIGN